MYLRRAVILGLALLMIGCGHRVAAPGRHSHRLTYHGGPVMRRLNAYVLLWLPPGHHFEPSGRDSRYEDGAKRYFRDVGGSSLYSVLTQYSHQGGTPVFDGPILNRSRLAGAYVDRDPYPSVGSERRPLSFVQVEDELTRVIAARHWKAGTTAGFFVLTAAGIHICDSVLKVACTFRRSSGGLTWCGVHNFFADQGRLVVYATISDVHSIYCDVDPYAGSAPQHDLWLSEVLPVISHEQFEMVTDPTLNAWRTDRRATSEDPYFEIADLCDTDYGTIGRDGANIRLHGHPYQLQTEWSDQAGACVSGVSSEHRHPQKADLGIRILSVGKEPQS